MFAFSQDVVWMVNNFERTYPCLLFQCKRGVGWGIPTMPSRNMFMVKLMVWGDSALSVDQLILDNVTCQCMMGKVKVTKLHLIFKIKIHISQGFCQVQTFT